MINTRTCNADTANPPAGGCHTGRCTHPIRDHCLIFSTINEYKEDQHISCILPLAISILGTPELLSTLLAVKWWNTAAQVCLDSNFHNLASSISQSLSTVYVTANIQTSEMPVEVSHSPPATIHEPNHSNMRPRGAYAFFVVLRNTNTSQAY